MVRTTGVEQSGVAATVARRLVPTVLALAAVVIVASVVLWKADVRAETGLPVGAHDFVAYWTAFDLGTDSGDPYDEADLQRAQVEINDRYEAGPQRFWNPPWALVVLGPVLLLPFELAASMWLVLQMMGGVVCAALSWRLLRPDRPDPPPGVLVLGVLFVPFFDGLMLGQMGVYVAVCLLGALVALRDGRDVTAGILIALLVAKPQTVLLVLLLIGVHVLVTRRWAVVWSSLAGVGAIVGSSALLFPSVWSGWDPLGGSPTHWYSATVAGWIRGWLPVGPDGPPTWPILTIPLVAMLFALPWVWANAREIPWHAVPGLLALSVLTAPYAWVSDSMVLVVIQIAAVVAATEDRRRFAILGIAAAAIQVTALVVRSQDWSDQQHMIIVPLALLALHLVARRAGAYRYLRQPDVPEAEHAKVRR